MTLSPEAAQRIEELERENQKLRDKNENQRFALKWINENNRVRNIEMDALHYVWCDGGCERGAHRWQEKPPTIEIVAAAVRNTNRLYGWFLNNISRSGNYSKESGEQFTFLNKELKKISDDSNELEQLKARIAELEAALEWRDIEKEKPREMEPLNVRLTQKVAVKIWFEGQWLYNYAQWDTCWNSWHGDSTAWTHWRPIEELEVKDGRA